MKPNGQSERRQYKRIHKYFIVQYYEKAHTDMKYEMTQIKNISLGGICLVTQRAFTPSCQLGLDLKTPFLVETTYLEGVVLESHERVKGVIYETRVKFLELPPETEFILKKVIDHFEKEEGLKS